MATPERPTPGTLRGRLTAGLLCLAWALSPVGASARVATQPLAPAELLVDESFDHIASGELPPGWTSKAGGWRVVDGALEGSPPAGETTLLLGPSSWSQVAVEARVRFLGTTGPSRWCALVVRESGPTSPGPQFTVRHATDRRNGVEIAVRRPPPGTGWRVLQASAAPASLADGKTHLLRIEARGHSIRGYLDERLVARSPRGAELSASGRVGIRLDGAHVRVDRIRVWRLAEAPGSVSALPRSRPLVIAHRGFSWLAPENTIAAYRAAIRIGVEMAECDVRLSADRVPVVIHDETLARTTGVARRVGDLPAAEITRLDAGSWKSPRYAGETVPQLRALLDTVDGKLRLVIEIKDRGMEEEVIDAIEASGAAPESVMIFSFDRDTVSRIARLEPLLPTTWLVGNLPPDEAGQQEVLRAALRARVSSLGLPRDRVYPEFLRTLHECGLGVFVWTVNDTADMEFLIRAGADAIITDRPDLLLEILNGGGRTSSPADAESRREATSGGARGSQ